MSETLLDAQFMKCPWPVLRAARALRHTAPGSRVRVLATDPNSLADFRAFCRDSGHALVSWSEVKGVYSFTIRHRPAPSESPS